MTFRKISESYFFLLAYVLRLLLSLSIPIGIILISLVGLGNLLRVEVLPKVLYYEVGFLLLDLHLFLYFGAHGLQALCFYSFTQLLSMHGHLLLASLVLNAELVNLLLRILDDPSSLLLSKVGYHVKLSDPALVIRLIGEATAFQARVISWGQSLLFLLRVDRLIL